MHSCKMFRLVVNECQYLRSQILARATTKRVANDAVERYMRLSSIRHTPETNTGETSNNNTNRKWDFQVTPFGRLIVDTNDRLNVRIDSLCPQKYPHMDWFVMDEYHNHPDNITPVPGSILGRVKCVQRDQSIVVTVSDEGDRDYTAAERACHIQIPVKFDVDVRVTGNAEVSVQTMENASVAISLGHGHCILCNIKTTDLRVTSQGGNITSQSLLQGNSVIKTHGQGNVTIDKPLGQSLHVDTDDGDISVTSLYVDAAEFVTKRGNVNIGSCHGVAKVEIKEQGDCSVGTVDGSLQAVTREGDIDVHLAQHTHVNLVTNEGDIRIGLSEGVSTDVSLEAQDVDLDSSLDRDQLVTQTNNGQTVVTGDISSQGNVDVSVDRPSLMARAKYGAISLQLQSWLDAIKLRGSFYEK